LLGILIVTDQFLNNEIINIVLVAFPVIFWIIYSVLTGILFKQSIGHLVLGTTLNTKSRFQAIFAILFSPTLFTDILLNIKITRLKKPPILIRLTTILASLSSLVIIPGLLLYTLSFLVILAEEAPLFFDNSISTSQIPLKGSIESTSITPSTIKSDQLKQPEENKHAPKSDQGSTELKKENKVIQQTAPKETIQDIRLRQLEKEKADLLKKAESEKKFAEFKEQEAKEWDATMKKIDKLNNDLEESSKRKQDIITKFEKDRKIAQEESQREQEERLAEQQYNSCMSDLKYCINGISSKVSASLGPLGSSSSAAGQMYSALQKECQRKYQCSR
jgi:hypothetical protein